MTDTDSNFNLIIIEMIVLPDKAKIKEETAQDCRGGYGEYEMLSHLVVLLKTSRLMNTAASFILILLLFYYYEQGLINYDDYEFEKNSWLSASLSFKNIIGKRKSRRMTSKTGTN